jgi:hypothetical protein
VAVSCEEDNETFVKFTDKLRKTVKSLGGQRLKTAAVCSSETSKRLLQAATRCQKNTDLGLCVSLQGVLTLTHKNVTVYKGNGGISTQS